jgi:ABC-type iron transport system FetAB permease component
MSTLIPAGSTSVVGRQSRYASKALSRLDDRVTVGVAEIEAEAELQATRVMAVSYVGKRAMHEVAVVSQLEQQLATLVPMATSRLQAIGDMLALDMADVVGNTVRRLG